MSPRAIRIHRLLELLCSASAPMLLTGRDMGFVRSLESCGFAVEIGGKWSVTKAGRTWLESWKRKQMK